MELARKLLSIASEPLSPESADPVFLQSWGAIGLQLYEMLSKKNGFMAFECALHVFPSDPKAVQGLEVWNDPGLWIGEYGQLAKGCLFFAEDLFGDQFFIERERIGRFSIEDGSKREFAADLEDWAFQILDDYAMHAGYPLAHAWQLLHGPIPHGQRLFAKKFFTLGGDYTLDNLYLMDAAKSLRCHGPLAIRLHDLPDGTQVVIKSSNWPP